MPTINDRQKKAVESLQGGVSDSFPEKIKALNWVVCLIVATYVALSNYEHVSHLVSDTSLDLYFALLAIISPTCLAVAWLRLTGTPWRRALSLFIWVSVAFGGMWLLLPYIGFILKSLAGQCC